MKNMLLCSHPFPPVYNKSSRFLILGSFPSVKSRQNGFYYGHPQNRFWKVLAHLLCSPIPVDIDEKKEMLLANGIALWDVLYSCEIEGSSDSSIKNAVPNDIHVILDSAHIEKIFANGKAAGRYYEKYLLPQTGISAVVLPSTSPANAAFSENRLTEAWGNALFVAGTHM